MNSMLVYGFISAFLLMAHFSLLFMVTKYFFVPNLVTLIEFAPMTMFGFSYMFFGAIFFVPHFNSVSKVCYSHKGNMSPLQFSNIVGDIMKYFVMGVMVICMQGYRVEGVTLWSCMTFILVGMYYLVVVTRKSYHLDYKQTDMYLITFRVTVFIFTFAMVLLVILVVSHTTFQRNAPKQNPSLDHFSDMDSGDEILGKYRKQRVFSKRELWLKTVNGYRNMADSHVIYRIVMVPMYFVISNLIPVISKDRYLMGWTKFISCLSLLVLPFICLLNGVKAVGWVMMLVVCWTLSILTFISTHSLRRPDNVWLFAFQGLIASSFAMNFLCREIENLAWQYISTKFDLTPDITALMYFGLGETFSEAIVIRCLQMRKMWDATFGVVMSMVTYAVFFAFPTLHYQDCYNPSCSVITTSSTETGIYFFFLIVTTSLLHISMSGYEFRMSLFFYLLILTVIYVTLQWSISYGWILSLASLRHIKKRKLN
ncbi:uncharacterized protein LOC108138140 [Drosophila elegans]|uniref:uncharacterized protein LOC108138140 n=1 Tax=Drosophila elegans TaxID=30023 RepID=UPI0007E67186|nr:uncharacterized protein LOC108138140 [Drosophila elegans]